MTTEQNKLADELERNARYSIGSDRSLFNRAAAALRAAGEPVAWLYNTRGDQKWRVTMDRPVQTDSTAFDKILPLGSIATQPAPSASVRDKVYDAALRELEVRHPIPTTVLLATKIANAVSIALSSTPSRLMAAGEAAETDIMETLDRKIEHAKCMQKRAFDQGLDVQGERMHARQEAFLEVKAILMKGSVATSPAKRDYVARVMGDALPCHKCAGWGFVQTTSGVFRTDTCPVCDGATVAAEPTREEIAKIIDPDAKLHDIEGVTWGIGTIDRRNEAIRKAAAILALKPRGGTTREEMWVHGFNSCLHAAIQALNYLSFHSRPTGGQDAYNSEHLLQISDEIKRTIAHNIALSKPRGEPAREGGK